MSRSHFVARGEPQWRRLEELLDQLDRYGSRRRSREVGEDELPGLFRRVCQDLALARHRLYSTGLIERLNALALRAHQRLYAKRGNTWSRLAEFAGGGFPRLVRQQGSLAVLGVALFFVPFFLVTYLVTKDPDLAYALAHPGSLAQAEMSYPAGADSVADRAGEIDVVMFGHYVWNNTRIGFMTFAWGLLFGVGTIYVMVSNGLVIGAVFGHIYNTGGGVALNSFVIGHGAFELTAIAISGIAGLRLGMALVAPGRRSRMGALRAAGRQAVPIMTGAMVMFWLAALLEAFWSPRDIPSIYKFVVGGILWCLVLAYFFLAGQRRSGRS